MPEHGPSFRLCPKIVEKYKKKFWNFENIRRDKSSPATPERIYLLS